MAIKKFRCNNEWCPVTTEERKVEMYTLEVSCKHCCQEMSLVPSPPASVRVGKYGKGG
jgi:hypothetical protein